MAQQIYVNLAVKDVARTKAFFEQLDFTFDAKFSNDKALCMIIGENIYAMLLAENFFKTFTKKTLCDATQNTEVIVCISRDSRAQVDDLVARAQTAGATVPRPPEDYGFMYGHCFEDLDGHIWELTYMDPNAEMPQGM